MLGPAYLPFLLALALLAPLALGPVSRVAAVAVTRVALALFGDYVGRDRPRRRVQRDLLRAAHVGVTQRVYAARTILYAALAGTAGSILGVYGGALLLAAFEVNGEAIRTALPPALGFLANLTRPAELGPAELFPLLLVSAATAGAGAALGTYSFRWFLLEQRARTRGSAIEATLPRTVAFVYALSRSGMSLPRVLSTLTRNQDVYGEAARELGVAVSEMNTFGTDALTALESLSDRTPSENMGEFCENLASVLGGGRNLSAFLREQYDRYQEEAESQQERYLELLATFAEAYVTVLVAGPLFLVTILVVVGLVLRDTLPLLRVVVYVAVPLASLGFVVYLDSVARSTRGRIRAASDGGADPRRLFSAAARTATAGPRTRSDGGAVTAPGTADDARDRWRTSRERLAAYERLERLLARLRRPAATVYERPQVTFLATVPLGLWWVVARAGALPLEPVPFARTVDSPVVEATLFALATYGVAYEIDKRRIRAVETGVPDFLDRLASVNDAGLTVVAGLRRLGDSEFGRLTPEIRRTIRDVEWGADVATALDRFDARVRSPMVSRAVALATNAMAASGDVAPVLEIAADEARATRRLNRERRQVMLTYLLVIYLSFAVFLAIVVALTVSFVPAVESAQFAAGDGGLPGEAGGGTVGALAGLREVDSRSYVVLFYHATAIQAVCSGVIAGQLGEGRTSDGVKHATLMLLVAYVTFAVIGA